MATMQICSVQCYIINFIASRPFSTANQSPYVVTLVSRLRHPHKQHPYNKQAVQPGKPISKSCDTGKLTGKQLGVATLAYRLGLTNLAALASLAGLLGWLGWLAWLAGLAGLALIQQTPSNDKEQLFLKNRHNRLQSRTGFTSKRLRLGSECVSDVRLCSTQAYQES